MKKKILIGSIIAVVIIVLASFSSVVGKVSSDEEPVELDVKEEYDATPIELKVQRIKELVQSINLQKIIVNPDGVLETIEEISTIIEEEDVRNYIEKTSEEDCGCEKPNEWGFPIICTTLLIMTGSMFILWMLLLILFMIPPNAVLDLLEFLLTPFELLYQLFDCPPLATQISF